MKTECLDLILSKANEQWSADTIEFAHDELKQLKQRAELGEAFSWANTNGIEEYTGWDENDKMFVLEVTMVRKYKEITNNAI